MITLDRLVNDLFTDPKLTDARLRSFADDHLLRLTLNNPGGVYTSLITATAASYTGYFGTITDLRVKEAIRQNLTITTRKAKALVLGRLHTVQGLVIYRFGLGSATYEAFFPHGMMEYTGARIDDLILGLNRFRTACATHLSATDPAEVGQVDADINAFAAARTAQRTVFAEEDALRTGRTVSRKDLTRQLTRNLLMIAADMIDDPDRFKDYYDPTYLPTRTKAGASGETIEMTIGPGATVNISEGLTPGTAL